MIGRQHKLRFAGIVFVLVLLGTLKFTTANLFAASKTSIFGDVSFSGTYAVTNNPTSNYEIWTGLGGAGSTITIKVIYTCASAGKLGFTASIGVGANSLGGASNPSVCNSGSGATKTVTFKMNSPCQKTPDGKHCFASFSINAAYNPSGPTNGGHFTYTLNVSGGGGPDISYAGNKNPTSPPGSSWSSANNNFGFFNGGTSPPFNFEPPCDFGTQKVYVSWSGVEYGAPYQNNGIHWTVIDDTTGNTIASDSGAALGVVGDGSVHTYGITVKAGLKYTWQWFNEGSTNEIVYSVPFSANSFDENVDCGGGPPTNQLPQGSLTLDCPNSQYTVTGISDPDDGAAKRNYRIGHGGSNVVGGPSTAGTTIDVSGKKVYGSQTGSLTVTVGRTYWLQVQDDDGTWINTDSASVADCSTSSGSASCTNYSHTLQPHSNYRITAFPTASTTETAPAVTSKSGSAPGSWATYTVPAPYAVAYQATLNSGSSYADGNASYTASPTGGTFALTYPTPSGPDWVVLVESWHYDSGSNTSTYGARWEGPQILWPSTHCYSATCSISIDGNIPPPDGGAGDVKAGVGYDATAHVINTGLQPLQSISWTGSANANGDQSQSVSIASGATTDILMNPQALAPGTLGGYSLGGSVNYGTYAVAGCTPASVTVYQHFTLVPSAGIDSSTSPENPTSITYDTGVTYGPDPNVDPYPGPVSSDTHSILNYIPYGGASREVDNVPRTDNYDNHSYKDTYDGPDATHYGGSAGDQFCPVMKVDNASGWIGPGATAGTTKELDQAGDSKDGGCLTVTNRPFFKVFDGGISAGGSFKTVDASGSGGGELSGWNNDTGVYPTTTSGDFGSAAQLNALALINIVGVASGQNYTAPAFGASPGNLTFANNPSSTSADAYSPKLNGAFDPGGSGYYLNDQTAPPGGDVTNVGSNYHLDDGAALNIPINDNKSVFVTGDVYIDQNVLYNTAGWVYNFTNNKIPSFVLHATGNIYIGPDVTQLDGVYIAQKEIYTCGTGGYTPMAASALFGGCNKQLTVNGAFVASQVNMMRTFGSQRDETPTPGVGAGVTVNAATWVQDLSSDPYPSGTDVCISLNPLKAGYGGVADLGYLCAQGNVHLAITSDGWVSEGGRPYPNCFITALGNNYQICSDAEINDYVQVSDPSTSTDKCANIDPSVIHAVLPGNMSLWICLGGMSVPPAPPVLTSCSNGDAASWLSRQTCAAEVFNLSPELYLSTPNVGASNNGAPEWDAVTSLPPVL